MRLTDTEANIYMEKLKEIFLDARRYTVSCIKDTEKYFRVYKISHADYHSPKIIFLSGFHLQQIVKLFKQLQKEGNTMNIIFYEGSTLRKNKLAEYKDCSQQPTEQVVIKDKLYTITNSIMDYDKNTLHVFLKYKIDFK